MPVDVILNVCTTYNIPVVTKYTFEGNKQGDLIEVLASFLLYLELEQHSALVMEGQSVV